MIQKLALFAGIVFAFCLAGRLPVGVLFLFAVVLAAAAEDAERERGVAARLKILDRKSVV